MWEEALSSSGRRLPSQLSSLQSCHTPVCKHACTLAHRCAPECTSMHVYAHTHAGVYTHVHACCVILHILTSPGAGHYRDWYSKIHPFILLQTVELDSIPGTLPGTGDTGGSKTDKSSCLLKAEILERKRVKDQIRTLKLDRTPRRGVTANI